MRARSVKKNISSEEIDAYLADFPRAVMEALVKTPLVMTPLVYKVFRFEMTVSSWYGTDAFFVGELWAAYCLLHSCMFFNPPRFVATKQQAQVIRQQQCRELSMVVYDPTIDSPLALKVSKVAPIAKQRLLQLLGCPVADVEESFKIAIQELFPYLYLETRDLILDQGFQPLNAFLSKIQNFEL